VSNINSHLITLAVFIFCQIDGQKILVLFLSAFPCSKESIYWPFLFLVIYLFGVFLFFFFGGLMFNWTVIFMYILWDPIIVYTVFINAVSVTHVKYFLLIYHLSLIFTFSYIEISSSHVIKFSVAFGF
jgi:hypothetical protein